MHAYIRNLDKEAYLEYEKKHAQHNIFPKIIDAFLAAQNYGMYHQKTNKAWYNVSGMICVLTSTWKIKYNPDPAVFYFGLSKFCSYDKFHTYGEQTILADIIRKRCYEYTKLTKLPSLKKQLVKKLICMVKNF